LKLCLDSQYILQQYSKGEASRCITALPYAYFYVDVPDNTCRSETFCAQLIQNKRVFTVKKLGSFPLTYDDTIG